MYVIISSNIDKNMKAIICSLFILYFILFFLSLCFFCDTVFKFTCAHLNNNIILLQITPETLEILF